VNSLEEIYNIQPSYFTVNEYFVEEERNLKFLFHGLKSIHCLSAK
jgi:hypothetical protein